jgi:hypothetical protein
MALEFRRRYGGRFEVFMNCCDRLDATPEPARSTARLNFIGALAPDRWRPLLSIGTALSELHSRGVFGELVIYTLPEDIRGCAKFFAGCGAIRMAGTAAPHEVRGLQLEANLLVHVESFAEATRRLTRLSLSTKIPQYLMAGRCVLAYGPPEAASIRYIADTGAGVAVSTEDMGELTSQLEILLTQPALRHKYAERARHTALKRHEAVAERQRFRRSIVAASNIGIAAGE